MNKQVGVIAPYVYVNTNKLVLGVGFVTNIEDCVWLWSNNIYEQDNKLLKLQLFTRLRFFSCPSET